MSSGPNACGGGCFHCTGSPNSAANDAVLQMGSMVEEELLCSTALPPARKWPCPSTASSCCCLPPFSRDVPGVDADVDADFGEARPFVGPAACGSELDADCAVFMMGSEGGCCWLSEEACARRRRQACACGALLTHYMLNIGTPRSLHP